MNPTHRLGCLGLIELIVTISEGAFPVLRCPHPPLLIDPFIFLLAYILEEIIDFHHVFRAKVSLRCFKVSGDRQSIIGFGRLLEARMIGGR